MWVGWRWDERVGLERMSNGMGFVVECGWGELGWG